MAPRNTRVTPETEVRSPARSFLNSLDNFYAPSRDVRGERAVQEGLNAFSGIIDQKASRIKGEMADDERQQGIQDALREQAGEEMKGVQTGQLFRQHSRFYMAGLNETRGRAAAARFKAETAQAYQDWEGRHTDDDGSSYREWMNTRVANFMGTLGEDQYRVAGALPIVNEVANNFAAQHTGFTAQRLETESFEAYDEIVSGVFSDLANGEFDMDEAISRIASEADDMYLTDGAEANNRVVQAAIRYANIHNDPDSILALARAHDSGRLPISQTNRERLANAMDAVEADINRNAANSNARLTAEQKAAKAATLDNWARTLEADPYADLPSTNEIGDADLRRDMMTLQSAVRTAAEAENPQLTAQNRILFEADLFEAVSVQDKLRVLANFVGNSPNSLNSTEITRYSREIMDQGRPDAMIKNTLVSDRRGTFGRGLADLQLGNGYSANAGSTLRTQGEIAFNKYVSTQGASVDQNDPLAMNQMLEAAEAWVMETLAAQHPTLMGEAVEDAPELANAMGADAAVASHAERVAEEALAAFQADAGIDPAAVVEGVTNAVTGPALDDPDYEDEAETQDPAVIASQPDSFYQEVMQRFTDGTDDRTNVSPSVLVETARRVLGADENAQNAMLQSFLADGGVNLDPSETAWCAGFMNSVLAQNGIDGTQSLAARSFLDWGEEVTDPSEGDIVVLSRGRRDGWKGHVGIFQGFDENGNILILGGNQGGGVNVTSYPAARLLGYRRPVGTPDSNTADTLQALANRG